MASKSAIAIAKKNGAPGHGNGKNQKVSVSSRRKPRFEGQHVHLVEGRKKKKLLRLAMLAQGAGNASDCNWRESDPPHLHVQGLSRAGQGNEGSRFELLPVLFIFSRFGHFVEL